MSAWVTACADAGAARPTVTSTASATREMRDMPLPPPRFMIRKTASRRDRCADPARRTRVIARIPPYGCGCRPGSAQRSRLVRSAANRKPTPGVWWECLVAPRHQPLEPADTGEVVIDDRDHEHHQDDKAGEEHLLLHLHAEV